MARIYNIELPLDTASGTSIVTLIEFTAQAAKTNILLRCWLSQRGSTTSAQQDIQITRKSAVGTNVTSPVANPVDVGDSAFAGTVRGMCTAEGTLTTNMYSDSFNWVNGWIYLPVPEERIAIVGAGILGLRLPTAPPSLTINAGMTVMELG